MNLKFIKIIVIVAAVCGLALLAVNPGLWMITEPSQDLTSYTEYNPDGVISVSQSTVTTTNAKRFGDNYYLVQDFGNDQIQDFVVHCRVKMTKADPSSLVGLLMFSNSATSNNWPGTACHVFYMYHYTEDANPGWLRFIYKDTTYTGGEHPNDRIIDYSPAVGDALDVDYWMTLTRHGVDITLQVYSDSARMVLIAEAAMSGTSDIGYRYMYAAFPYGVASGDPARDALEASSVLSDIYYENWRDYTAPTAAFTWSPTSPMGGTTVAFDASNSIVAQQQNMVFEWDFNGDGIVDQQNVNTFAASYTYSTVGTYNVELTVSDATASHSISHALTVRAYIPETYALTVSVLDSVGVPVENATVTIVGTDVDMSDTTIGGQVAFSLVDGLYSVTADKAGYTGALTTVTISGEDAAVSLVLNDATLPGFELVMLFAAVGVFFIIRRKRL